jgi:tetratricopeptide (TPR) repeat protein
MPQIQVLGREALEDQQGQMTAQQNQQKMMQEAIAATNEAKYKQGVLEYNKELAKIEARKATSEEEKIKLDNKVKNFEIANTMYKMAVKNATGEDGLIKMDLYKKNLASYGNVVNKKFPEAWEIFASLAEQEPSAMGDVDTAKTYQEAMKAKAEALKAQGSGRQANEIANILRKDRGLEAYPEEGQPGTAPAAPAQIGAMEQPPNVPNVPGAGMQTIGGPGQPMGNAPIIPEITSDGVKIIRPQAAYQAQYNESMASKTAERDIELVPLKASWGNYKKVFAAAAEEIGGLGKSGIEALAKGGIGTLGSRIGDMPNTFASTRLIESFGLQLASYLNRGRPATPDQVAAIQKVRMKYCSNISTLLLVET